jgi:EAL domain-containing protein (putative c-di-GMP-specific phosphodiesterase class I)
MPPSRRAVRARKQSSGRRRTAQRSQQAFAEQSRRPAAALTDDWPLTTRVEMQLQPIVDVRSGALLAVEALARFPHRPGVSTDQVFALARAVGLGPQLEARCLQAALDRRIDIPAHVMLTVNVSPDALAHPDVRAALSGTLAGVVVEITEHEATHLSTLQADLADLRRRGAQIAIDDASTGYAGLLRLTALRPDVVKLDRDLVAGARDSIEQVAVIEALVSLSRRIGARVLGEGVEELDDLIGLAELDVDYAQGWFLGRPAATVGPVLPQAVAACRSARRSLLNAGAGVAPADWTAHIGSITAALAGSIQFSDLHAALRTAATNLRIDVIGLSELTEDGRLLEVTSSGERIDGRSYRISDFPATASALADGRMVEAHLEDPDSDPAERAQLAREGMSSLLLTPVIGDGQPLGILEFQHRSRRRWSSHEMGQARVLAEHVASVLVRINKTRVSGFVGSAPHRP